MSQAKKHGAVVIAAGLAIVVAVAVFVTAQAWTFVPALAIVLGIHLASPIDDDPGVPNSPLKIAFFVAMFCFGLLLVVLGFTSKTIYLLAGAALLCITIPALWMIHHGRNPWWMRGWADYSGRR
jgi:hypothetical protein